jgi:hypothetical protein
MMLRGCHRQAQTLIVSTSSRLSSSSSIVEPRRARAGMVRHLRRHLRRAAVLTQAHPWPAVLREHVLDLHAERGTNARSLMAGNGSVIDVA